MKKSVLAFALAGCACIPTAWTCMKTAEPASALTLIAYIMDVTVKKDVIAVGESVKLELVWSNGATQEVFYFSSDESVLQVDQNGVVTGVSDGTAEISVRRGSDETCKTITMSVSSDVRISSYYNTSELTLGMKLYEYDTLHYDKKSIGMTANIVNDEGSYDMAHLLMEDYVLPFDAEVVGFDGLTLYLAPEYENVKYVDGRTLTAGDVIDTSCHLLCYDYHINRFVFPVFLPKYYEKYIGEGTIRVVAVDHEQKTIELEAVSETETVTAGDADADGTFGVTDVVLFQKWLCAAPEVQIANWEAVDFCADGMLDAFDLAIMKRMLVQGE